MDWFLASVLSLICIVCYRLFLKYFLSTKKVTPSTFSILESLVAMFISLFFVILFGFEFSGDLEVIVTFIIKSFASGGAALLLVTSLKHITASENQIIGSSRIFITILTGYLFYDEKITTVKILSGIIIIISILLVSLRKGKLKLSKYHFLAFASTFIFGLVYTADKYISDYFNTFTMLFLAFVFSQIFKFSVTPRNLKLIPRAIKQKMYILPTMITGTFLSGIYLFQYYAYQKEGDLSTVNIIKGTSTVFIVTFSVLFLKDKEIKLRKIIAAILVSATLIMIKIL
jgi:drug/metabolite transporter (DMT)-like permease